MKVELKGFEDIDIEDWRDVVTSQVTQRLGQAGTVLPGRAGGGAALQTP